VAPALADGLPAAGAAAPAAGDAGFEAGAAGLAAEPGRGGGDRGVDRDGRKADEKQDVAHRRILLRRD
jgi:hypothetical protein